MTLHETWYYNGCPLAAKPRPTIREFVSAIPTIGSLEQIANGAKKSTVVLENAEIGALLRTHG